MIRKYSIMLSLSKLYTKLAELDLESEADDISELLLNLLDDGERDEDMDDSDVTDILANSVGLQESSIHEYYGGAFSVEPFFFDSGDLS